MTKEKEYYSRGFLNPKEGMAAYEAHVAGIYPDEHKPSWHSAYFSITDCSRKVTLDFGFDDEKGYEAVMHKFTQLRTQLTFFQLALEEAAELYFQKRKEWDNK